MNAGAIGEALLFVLSHLDVLEVVIEAIDGGASKEAIKNAIRAEMVKASDELMRKELEP